MAVGTECTRRVRAGMTVVQSIEIQSLAKEHRAHHAQWCAFGQARVPCVALLGDAWKPRSAKCDTGARARQAVMGDVVSMQRAMQCDQEKTD
ncbi:hypothetical protein B7G54_11360 [Burkholderia puraquae]|uniref:Uncharacterized protein n=1 Tax=Burkholderia puraquae TaxID=1904757 RepID=A0A1X1PKA1_9BURK|nr:hypothetical protein [Burkholderia puraquae]ORT87039.1 hypothetical protein B7G54_11360 [Burkholderia puraquae]CAB3768943.1 hypothetical protein LMG29660_06247 [Burkholderia puraquae]